jgi:hypothetical protein
MSGPPSKIRDRFIHIADLHFWRVVWNPFRMCNKRFFGNLTVLFNRARHFHMELAEPFADHAAATGARAVVLTGDFVSTATHEEYRMALEFVHGLRRRNLAVHLVPGNHDVYTFEAHRARRFEHYFEEFLPEGGYPARVTLPGGTPLILGSGVTPRHFSASGLIKDDAVDRIGVLLQACESPAVVAIHYPYLDYTGGYHSHPLRRMRGAHGLRDVLGQSGKDLLYVAGHCHRFSYTHDSRYPNLRQLTTGALFNLHDGAHGEFSEVTVANTGFTVTRHLLRDQWHTQVVDPEPSEA